MNENMPTNFLEQFERSENNVASWPSWMQKSAVLASAALTQVKTSNSAEYSRSADGDGDGDGQQLPKLGKERR